MKTLFITVAMFMLVLGILGMFVSNEYGESAQFFILSILCFRAAEEKS